MSRRKLPVAAISDVHLGTYGCHAAELVQYLQSIDPGILILNGDIIDIWEFKKKYFPSDHLKVIKEIFRMAARGTKVYYITGNHDDVLRRFSNLKLGPIRLEDKMVLQINGKKTWIFHGDVFDMSIQITPLLAKMGSKCYDWLIKMNRVTNKLLERLNRPKISLAHNIKHSVKRAVKFVQDFEKLAIEAALEKGYDYVLCGHIHRPALRQVTVGKKSVTYLNCGDWIENLSVLEHNGHEWCLRFHSELFLESLEITSQENKGKPEEIIAIIDEADDVESLDELLHLSTIITISQEGLTREEEIKMQRNGSIHKIKI